MNTRRINGLLFERLLYNGLANLKNAEQKLNSLNVFPVADGDTGTNMHLTLENGLRYARKNETLCTYLSTLNDGMLLGARGNSGVILSQIFKGIYQYLARCSAANCGDMRNAFIQGYKTAYQAVVQPVEGTILTVAREGIENIRTKIDRSTTMEELFSMYVDEMKKSLAHTPELLPVLRSSGVVDSGALGYITIIEGMSKYLNGEILNTDEITMPTQKVDNRLDLSYEAFNENSTFEDGYCMEFILQLMSSPDYLQNFKLEDFIKQMKTFGNSIAVTQEKTRVKVHIHTKKPAYLVTLAQRYGEFLTFKLENMQLQHNEQIKKPRIKRTSYSKPLGFVAVANGEGLCEEFKALGCDIVIDGGATMNTSSSEFVAAYEDIDAEHIVVLPNSKNVIGAAEQAVKLCERENVHVLPTRSIAEGYFAVAMDVKNENNIEKRIANIKVGAEDVATLSVAVAEKPFEDETVSCKPGDHIAVLNDKIVFAADTPEDAFIGGLGAVDNIDRYESCTVFSGQRSNAELEGSLEDRMGDEYPDIELGFVNGGQPTYIWICALT